MNKYRIAGIVLSIMALLFNAGCGGGNPTPAPSSTGAAATPEVTLPDGIPTPPVSVKATPTFYQEFPADDGSGTVQVWSFSDRSIGHDDLAYAGMLGLTVTTELTAGELVAIVVTATVVYYIFLAMIGAEPPTITIPEVMAAPEPSWYVVPTTAIALQEVNMHLASSLVPQLTPQDLSKGMPTEGINIAWGTLTWYSWCNSNNGDPYLYFGLRKGETLDNRTIKVPGCDQFPLSKSALISLVRSFKDSVRKVFGNLSETEILQIIQDIDDFANLLVKYLPNF